MGTDETSQVERLQMRVYDAPGRPTLIYLPGLHGDWTLVGGFRREVEGKVRFVEFIYPRTLTWSLDDYARAIEEALASHGIHDGWLLGESYGSQVLWAMLRRGHFKAHGAILAGGFVAHPMRWGVRLAERLLGGVSLRLLAYVLFGYSRIARFRFRRSPETVRSIDEFIARRTPLDLKAAQHRLRLIATHRAEEVARSTHVPVFAITGLIDPIVPWWFVRRWLKKSCPRLMDYRIVPSADHTILATGPKVAARQMLDWMSRAPQ